LTLAIFVALYANGESSEMRKNIYCLLP